MTAADVQLAAFAREERLPLWARDELKALRRKVDEAERMASAALLNTDPKGSSALLRIPGALSVYAGLGANARVRFNVGGPEGSSESWVDANVTTSYDHRGRHELQLMGGTGLLIAPQASNVVRITTAR